MREKVINRSRPAEPEGLPAVRGEYSNDVLEHGLNAVGVLLIAGPSRFRATK